MASGKPGFKQIQEIARPKAATPHQPLSLVGFRLVSYGVDDGVCVFGRWRSLVVGCACISPYVDPALAMEICICIIGRLLFSSNLFEILLITNSNMNVFNVLVFLLQPASAQKRLSASVARRLSASVVIADGAVVLAGNRVERGAPAELPSPNLFAAARGGGMPEKSWQMVKQNDHYLIS